MYCSHSESSWSLVFLSSSIHSDGAAAHAASHTHQCNQDATDRQPAESHLPAAERCIIIIIITDWLIDCNVLAVSVYKLDGSYSPLPGCVKAAVWEQTSTFTLRFIFVPMYKVVSPIWRAIISHKNIFRRHFSSVLEQRAAEEPGNVPYALFMIQSSDFLWTTVASS